MRSVKVKVCKVYIEVVEWLHGKVWLVTFIISNHDI
jgi:hypothetical protein